MTHVRELSLTQALPPLPPLDDLSMPQTCGRACVWCAVTLSTATAVELGRRTATRAGVDFVWFPRSCRACAVTATYKALLDHAQKCPECADKPGGCAEGSELRAAVRKVRR